MRKFPNRTTVIYAPSWLGRRAGVGLALAGLAAPIAVVGTQALLQAGAQAQQPAKKQTILLVSYAVTKASYDRIIPLFKADYKRRTGQDVDVKTSYGGSGSQTRAVIDGLEADVVGLAMTADVLKIQEKGLINPGWEKELPNNSIATNSTVVAFIRPGNPKKINGWRDLDNKNVESVLANPKTSGGARWNFLALWGAITRGGGTEAQARSFITGVYKNAEVLPKDAREATDTFVKRKQGDVLLNWESEAILARRTGEWTTPVKTFSPNVLTEQPIAVVDRYVDKKGTRKAAEALAAYLSSEPAQEIFAEEGFRPVNAGVWARVKDRFATVKTLFSAADFGGWSKIDTTFFGKSGGLWDDLFRTSR